MAFEMENSSTGNAAKLAVLWRDRSSGGGSSDAFVDSVMRGAYERGHDGTGLANEPTRYTGHDKLSVHGAMFRGYDGFGGPDMLAAFNHALGGGSGLASVVAMLVDLRGAIRGFDGVPQTNQPVSDGLDPEVWKGNVLATFEFVQGHIERLEQEIEALKADVRRLESRT